jgi:hypothetical protein
MPSHPAEVHTDVSPTSGTGPSSIDLHATMRVASPETWDVFGVSTHTPAPGQSRRWGGPDGRAFRFTEGFTEGTHIDVLAAWTAEAGPLEVALENTHTGELTWTRCTSSAGGCESVIPAPAIGDYQLRLRNLGSQTITLQGVVLRFAPPGAE